MQSMRARRNARLDTFVVFGYKAVQAVGFECSCRLGENEDEAEQHKGAVNCSSAKEQGTSSADTQQAGGDRDQGTAE